jgi:hypothetical protein
VHFITLSLYTIITLVSPLSGAPGKALASFLVFFHPTGKTRGAFPWRPEELTYKKLTDYMLICAKKIRVNFSKRGLGRQD